MKQLLILATMLLTFNFTNAQSKIWSGNSSYKDKVIGYYEGGKIWSGNSSYKDKVIGYYDGPDSGAAAAAYLLLL